jgi:hypothetical protein
MVGRLAAQRAHYSVDQMADHLVEKRVVQSVVRSACSMADPKVEMTAEM